MTSSVWQLVCVLPHKKTAPEKVVPELLMWVLIWVGTFGSSKIPSVHLKGSMMPTHLQWTVHSKKQVSTICSLTSPIFCFAVSSCFLQIINVIHSGQTTCAITAS